MDKYTHKYIINGVEKGTFESPQVIGLRICDAYIFKGKPEGSRLYAAEYVNYLLECSDWVTPNGYESALTVIPYVLNNLKGWRGEQAKEAKSTLKSIYDALYDIKVTDPFAGPAKVAARIARWNSDGVNFIAVDEPVLAS